MEKIGFIEISLKKNGGVWYNQKVKGILSKYFDLESIVLVAKFLKNRRYLKFLESFYYLFTLKGEKDVWMRDFYSVLFLRKNRTKGKNVALIFHIDPSQLPLLSRLPIFLLEKLFFYRQLRHCDAIITISEYWKNYFLKRGYKNVYKVYCGFDINNFNISEQEILDFKKKYNLEGKPVIYLGNCQKAKGAVDAYQALKGMDAYLVTSGIRHSNVPTLNFNLDYREYLTLLKASSIAVTMSKFKEGWCITAHEAMLLKTPVIGLGLDGVRELLEGGKQIILDDFDHLKENVEDLLAHPEKRRQLGESGFNFTKDFTEERFEKGWADLIKNVINLK